MQKTRRIITRVAEISIDEDGIILITMLEAVDVDEFDIADIYLIIRHLTNNLPALKLVDSRNKWSVSPAAKKISMQSYSNKYTLARAIVVSNNLKAGILSFMKRFESVKHPQHYFTEIEEARNWLLSLKIN